MSDSWRDELVAKGAAADAARDAYKRIPTAAIRAMTAIKALPSAQPEVIRCKDCKYGSPNGRYGCKCYHYRLYETHEMYEHDFCSRGERK